MLSLAGQILKIKFKHVKQIHKFQLIFNILSKNILKMKINKKEQKSL